jgi:hypothetical protein
VTKCKYLLWNIRSIAQLKYSIEIIQNSIYFTVIISVKITGMTEQRVAISATCDLCRIKKYSYPVTGREGPSGCETSRLPHFLNSQPTNGGEVVSFTPRPPFTPQEDSWYSFLLEPESAPGP